MILPKFQKKLGKIKISMLLLSLKRKSSCEPFKQMNTSNTQTSVLYFNGIDDKIDVQYNRELNPESFTIEARAKSEQIPDIDRSVLTSRSASYNWGYIVLSSPRFWQIGILDSCSRGKVSEFARRASATRCMDSPGEYL